MHYMREKTSQEKVESVGINWEAEVLFYKRVLPFGEVAFTCLSGITVESLYQEFKNRFSKENGN